MESRLKMSGGMRRKPTAHRLTPTAIKPGPDSAGSSGLTGYRHHRQEEEEQDVAALEALIAGYQHGTVFDKAVWRLLLQIPRGCVTTYGILAAQLGSSPRAVGNALRRNPYAPRVPCHRVIATGGKLGGFKGMVGPRDGASSAKLVEKRMLLRREGIKFGTASPSSKTGEEKVLGTPFTGFAPP
ncbi:6-O-methylguanine DNA methyltransferase [Lasiosphaeria miniovina]|uniref:Methylated-DNA--protein-cysteine methyltransferase n=1 Tax=Lasiosphaeria miniovina TaxID=1954250 RepID=A0AA40A0A9_9PEZI|nr:6-O-methylguanine DNA methyltransferase [Lasiosphaeria miniovina]KAK0706943.1 6-O-methylguanine DNA methyltransferase [Lasiosphaeria miniovina]